VWISLPVMFMVAAILHANNIRDMEADRAVNKRTMAVMFGLGFARAEYAFLVGGAYVSAAILALLDIMPLTTLLALITLPEAYRLVQIYFTRTDTPMLHQAQGRTARLHGQFGLLIVIGWLIWLGIETIV
jgi:1,4-dihydroxy-2-naphthoate octaprenyltransferase